MISDVEHISDPSFGFSDSSSACFLLARASFASLRRKALSDGGQFLMGVGKNEETAELSCAVARRGNEGGIC